MSKVKYFWAVFDFEEDYLRLTREQIKLMGHLEEYIKQKGEDMFPFLEQYLENDCLLDNLKSYLGVKTKGYDDFDNTFEEVRSFLSKRVHDVHDVIDTQIYFVETENEYMGSDYAWELEHDISYRGLFYALLQGNLPFVLKRFERSILENPAYALSFKEVCKKAYELADE